MRAEIYVVSIYRRGDHAGREAAGVVKRPGTRERKAFASSGELWALICDLQPPAVCRKQNPVRGKVGRFRAFACVGRDALLYCSDSRKRISSARFSGSFCP